MNLNDPFSLFDFTYVVTVDERRARVKAQLDALGLSATLFRAVPKPASAADWEAVRLSGQFTANSLAQLTAGEVAARISLAQLTAGEVAAQPRTADGRRGGCTHQPSDSIASVLSECHVG